MIMIFHDFQSSRFFSSPFIASHVSKSNLWSPVIRHSLAKTKKCVVASFEILETSDANRWMNRPSTSSVLYYDYTHQFFHLKRSQTQKADYYYYYALLKPSFFQQAVRRSRSKVAVSYASCSLSRKNKTIKINRTITNDNGSQCHQIDDPRLACFCSLFVAVASGSGCRSSSGSKHPLCSWYV